MPTPPLRTELADTYPNPSNAVMRAGMGKLWDYVIGLLGSLGTAADARATLGARGVGDDVTLAAGKLVVFEGASDDAYETTLTVIDPTADRTLSLPNKSGTLAVTSDISSTPQIQPLPTPTFNAGAMTIPSAAYVLDFRSATPGAGGVTTVSGSPAALVVPSGATLGTASGQQATLAILEMNNAGTLEQAIVNTTGGIDLSETGVISTTAISSSANSANVVYSTAARSNVAYRVAGYYISTQATAGTWATSPSLVQGAGGESMKHIGAISNSVTVATTSGTVIDLTGVPSWAKRITLSLRGVSTNGTDNIQAQLITSAAVTTGYASTSSSSGGTVVASTSGFNIQTGVASNAITGHLILFKHDDGYWTSSHTVKVSTTATSTGGGGVSVSAPVTGIRLTTIGATDTFDAGSVTLAWE